MNVLHDNESGDVPMICRGEMKAEHKWHRALGGQGMAWAHLPDSGPRPGAFDGIGKQVVVRDNQIDHLIPRMQIL